MCLFSGGLDSTIGALDLLAKGTKPLLVSHAYRGDQARQNEIHAKLPVKLSHFAPNANPTGAAVTDVSMRTRSLNFIAFGAVAAAVLAPFTNKVVPLFMPENGVISLNPPLTPRRIGSLST